MWTQNKPVSKIEIWPLKAAIWRNVGTDNRLDWFNVTLERTYKEGEEYKSSASFGRDDLLPLAKILDAAHTVILRLEKADHNASKGAAAGKGKPTADDDVPF